MIDQIQDGGGRAAASPDHGSASLAYYWTAGRAVWASR